MSNQVTDRVQRVNRSRTKTHFSREHESHTSYAVSAGLLRITYVGFITCIDFVGNAFFLSQLLITRDRILMTQQNDLKKWPKNKNMT